MAEAKIEDGKSSPVFPLLLGGLIGKKKDQSSGGEDIYCQVPEGADICFDQEKSG